MYVCLVNNTSTTAYVSTGLTDTTGLFTINNIPPGVYTVYTGGTPTGPWTATGDNNYDVAPSFDTIQTPTFVSPLTIDASAGQIVVVGILTNNITINAPTNPAKGQRLTLQFTQDGTGSRTVTWNAVFKVTWVDTGNTLGKRSAITFFYDGTSWNQMAAQTPYV